MSTRARSSSTDTEISVVERPKSVKKRVSKKVKDVEKIAKRVVRFNAMKGMELKFSDVTSSLVANTTQTFYDLSSNITQGVGDSSNRVGDELKVSSLDYRFWITTPSTGTQNMWRVTFFRWMPDTTSVAPTAGTIYSTPMNIISPLRHDSRCQFKLIADHFIPAPISSNDVKLVMKKVSGKYLPPIEFTGAGIQGCNHIFMCVWAAVVNTNDSLFWYTRTNYTDA